MAHDTAQAASYVLPVLVAGPVDVGRLIRELETLDTSLLQHKLQDKASSSMPKTSRLLDQLAQLNKLDLGNDDQRKQLHTFLLSVKKNSPILHISFSADPNVAFIEKIMAWLRQEIDPLVLMTIGLQPNIGAGCVVRSTNKYFDFTLRKNFDNKRALLIAGLGASEVAANRKPTITALAPVPVAAPTPAAATAQELHA